MTALTQNTICKCQDGNQLADSQNFCWKYYVTDYLLQTRLTNFRWLKLYTKEPLSTYSNLGAFETDFEELKT